MEEIAWIWMRLRAFVDLKEIVCICKRFNAFEGYSVDLKERREDSLAAVSLGCL